MTSLSKISLADLAKNTTLKFAKAGGAGTAKGPYVDPFTLDACYAVEFTAEEVTERPDGSPQMQLSVSIINDDGSLKKAGKIWVDLISGDADAATQTKQGTRLLKFLRAVDPSNFSVYTTLDKSVEPWAYLDENGTPIPADERSARADAINDAVVGASEGLAAGELSVVGMRCFITKTANERSPKYPWVNFSAEARS